MIRYHLDENIDHAVALGLRRRGIDVTTAVDAGLLGASDQDQLAFALAQGRVMVTHDADMLRLHRQGQPHAGIAFAPARRGVGTLVQALTHLWRNTPEQQMLNQVQFL